MLRPLLTPLSPKTVAPQEEDSSAAHLEHELAASLLLFVKILTAKQARASIASFNKTRSSVSAHLYVLLCKFNVSRE